MTPSWTANELTSVESETGWEDSYISAPVRVAMIFSPDLGSSA